MSNRQVIILWIVAIALGIAVTTVKIGQSRKTDSSTKRSPGQTLFQSFPASDVASIEIDGGEKSATIHKRDGRWTVAQRDDYPADHTMVNGLLRQLGELKVTQGIEAGASFAPRFGMDEAASKAADHGLVAAFKDASGKEIARVTIGKEIGGEETGGPVTGRFIRNHADDSGFYATSEMFSGIGDDPKLWLADDFFKVEKIASIALSEPGKTDIAWKLERESDDQEFTLAGAAPGQTADPAVVSPLKSLFAYSRFEDVVPAAEFANREQPGLKRTLTVTTVEGFTYTLTFVPAKTEAAPANDDPTQPAPPPEESYLLTIDVSADLPTERKKEDGESEEDAKTKDLAFAERHKTLTEKLKTEQALAGRTFEVSKFTVDPVLKDRDSLIKKDEAAAAQPVPRPTGGVTAVTPPISIPPLEAPPEENESGD